MSSLENLLKDILGLPAEEQEQLALLLSQSGLGSSSKHWPSAGIDSSAEICGGEPRIVRTRIAVWVLEQMRRLGVSEADILKSYPTLRAEDLVNAWAYVDAHRDEIDRQIRANEEA